MSVVDPALPVDLKTLPSRLNNLRACLQCKLIKSEVQFAEEGCDNCPNVGLSNISSYTTPTFQGFLGCYDPQRSWVARWQRQNHRKPGLYALQVTGDRPQSREDDYEADEVEEDDD